MTAAEAREKALHRRTEDYPDIKQEIEDSVNDGKLETWWHKPISDETKAMLEKDGYTVGKGESDPDGYLVKSAGK